MGSRILLADDSITIQKVVNLTFADEGIEVVAVSSGDLAERRLNEVKPDLVLADIFMPGKNGYELCEAIKQNSQFRNVPVVLLVGAFEPFDQAEARRVRADAHLTKPFESRTLVETVRRLISGISSTTNTPANPVPAPNGGHEAVRDVREGSETSPPLASAPAVKLDLSAMTADSNVTRLTRPARTTGELASPAPDSSPGLVGLGVVDTSTHEVFSATLTNMSERFEPMELSSTDAFAPAVPPSPLDLDAQETILDFDKSEPFESPTPHRTAAFEPEASALLDVDVSGVGEGAEWSSRDDVENAKLDMLSRDATWQPSAPISKQASDFSLETAGFGASPASTEPTGSTLLAVDEPLGDVLFDAALSDDPPLSQMPSSDSLDFEFTEPGVADVAPEPSTQFNVVDAGEGSRASFTAMEKLQMPGSEGTLKVGDQPKSAEAGSTVDVRSDSQEAVDSLGWTSPRAGVYSTDQLESVVMPIDEAEHPSQSSEHMDAQQQHDTQEASFTTASMWKEEQTRFTPIDVEAVHVEAPEAPGAWGGAVETGFSFSSVPAEQPTTSVEAPAASVIAEPASPPVPELSSAAIEDIVRRVVAEVSESVVREVAWEVVPDCVERVIEQLTRESLSKRM